MRARRFIDVIALMTLLVGCVHAAQEPQAPLVTLEQDCSRLLQRSFETSEYAARILSATAVAAQEQLSEAELVRFKTRGKVQGAPIQRLSRVPAFCRVEGYLAPSIRFELRLPLAYWNGRYLLVACDGFCGDLNTAYCVPGQVRGFATATTDGGHTGSPAFDGVWGWNNPQAEIDFGYRANHQVALASKAIIAAFYGRAPNYSYLTGCSKGGQAGVMAAIRYPDDFQGIVAGAPVLDYQRKNAIHFPWVARAMQDEAGMPLLHRSKLPPLRAAVMAACDATDGLRDGIIGDPRRCKFDPGVLACKGPERDDCLTPAQIAGVRRAYQPPVNSRGEMVYPHGTVVGSEGNWLHWLILGEQDHVTDSELGAAQYLRYLAFRDDPGPTYDWRDFNFDTDLARLDDLSPVFDALSPDLRQFRALGGKLLLWHGWADAAISPLMTIDYYEELTRFMGGDAATREFARLFLMPGMFHCRGGDGPDLFDALDAVVQWTERGIAPDRLIATKDDNNDGVAERTRPVFPYPQQAVYDGSGSIDEAANFIAR